MVETRGSRSNSKLLYLSGMFVSDETVPCGTKMPPGCKFKKVWRVRNTGTKAWNSRTTLKYCWGNSDLEPQGKIKEVPVPPLKPWQEGRITVRFTAPKTSGFGFYQSHWRLHHRGQPFGQRMICTISVDPKATFSEKTAQETSKKIKKLVRKQEKTAQSIEDALSAVRAIRFASDLESVAVIPIVKSSTTTPTNTPFDVSPPKSPEPCVRSAPQVAETRQITSEELDEQLEDYARHVFNLTEVSKSLEQANAAIDSAAAVEESNGSASGEPLAPAEFRYESSIFSLSSGESADEFVVVPLPRCFDLTAPFAGYASQPESELPTGLGSRADSFEIMKFPVDQETAEASCCEAQEESAPLVADKNLIEIPQYGAVASVDGQAIALPSAERAIEMKELGIQLERLGMSGASSFADPGTAPESLCTDASLPSQAEAQTFEYSALPQDGSSEDSFKETRPAPESNRTSPSASTNPFLMPSAPENVIHVLPEVSLVIITIAKHLAN